MAATSLLFILFYLFLL